VLGSGRRDGKMLLPLPKLEERRVSGESGEEEGEGESMLPVLAWRGRVVGWSSAPVDREGRAAAEDMLSVGGGACCCSSDFGWGGWYC
jgi:hypothetical protein